MKIVIDLKGTQTESHCSIDSSIGHCECLNTTSEKCTLFKQKLEYDFDAHAYKKCENCLKAQYVEDFKEELRISELGNKQLLEECKIIFQEKLEYWKVLTWIKGQYDTDFTKEELQQLKPRDAAIYETIEEVLKTS